MAKYYPINVDLEGKDCIVVGGGGVAERKAKRLLSCGAKVTVISPELTVNLSSLAKNNKLKVKKHKVSLKDLKSAYMVISASDDRKTNSSVSAYCRKKQILVNVVDLPDECDFILPSIVSRGDLTVTISTGGVSPALSKRIRKEIEKLFGPEYTVFLRIMKKFRPEVINRLKTPAARKKFFGKVVRSGLINSLKRKKEPEIWRELERMLKNE